MIKTSIIAFCSLAAMSVSSLAQDDAMLTTVLERNISFLNHQLPTILYYADKGAVSAADVPAEQADTVDDVVKSAELIKRIIKLFDAKMIVAPAGADANADFWKDAERVVSTAAIIASFLDVKVAQNPTADEKTKADWISTAVALCSLICDKPK